MEALVEFIQQGLAAKADSIKAPQMAAYLKTDMPFYGVQTPDRRELMREVRRRFVPGSTDEYRAMVEAVWALPHREEKYAAITIATSFPEFITFDQLDLYQRLIQEGAWWDLVDGVAPKLVGKILLDDRERLRPTLEVWIDHDDMWLRRSAIICQLDHKDDTDVEMLFEFCRRRAHEKEFFIRKAIGWALRQYARTDPDAVTGFLLTNRESLSGLSFREAAKHLALS